MKDKKTTPAAERILAALEAVPAEEQDTVAGIIVAGIAIAQATRRVTDGG